MVWIITFTQLSYIYKGKWLGKTKYFGSKNSFIQQGISSAAPWTWNLFIHSMIFIESVYTHTNFGQNTCQKVVKSTNFWQTKLIISPVTMSFFDDSEKPPCQKFNLSILVCFNHFESLIFWVCHFVVCHCFS